MERRNASRCSSRGVSRPTIELVSIDKFQGATGVRTDAVKEGEGAMSLVILPSLKEGPNGIGIG